MFFWCVEILVLRVILSLFETRNLLAFPLFPAQICTLVLHNTSALYSGECVCHLVAGDGNDKRSRWVPLRLRPLTLNS